MTIKQAIQELEKLVGKQVEYHSYDPDAKYQCVDLVNYYINLLGLDPVIGTHAKDFPLKINKEQFEVLKKTPEFIPIAGDIVVWNGRVGGGYGHIAVIRDNNATLDQNWSKPLHVTLETHNYKNVSYFLRPKEKEMSKELDACLKDRQKFWDERDELLRELNAESVEGGINTIRGLRSRITDLTNQVGTAQASQKNAEDKLSKQADEVIRTKEELNLCKSQMEQVKKSLNETMNDRNEIRDSLEKAKLQIETLKQQQQQGEITLTIKDLITLLLQSKITIRRSI